MRGYIEKASSTWLRISDFFLVIYRLTSFNAKKLTLVEPLLSNGSIYFKVLTSKVVGNHSQEGIKWFNFGRPLTYVFKKVTSTLSYEFDLSKYDFQVD
jgi:hypothetical protein